MPFRGLLRWSLRAALVIGAIIGVDVISATRADAATCYYATSKATHALCFLDMTGVSGSANTTNLTYTLVDGSTLTLTLANTGTVSSPPTTLPISNNTNFALGNTAYVGVLGEPAFYGAATGDGAGPITLSKITLTDTQGRVLPNVTIVGIDPEDTGQGDATTNALTWATQGTNLAIFQILPTPGTLANTPICALTNNGTNANCSATNTNPAAAYTLSSVVTPTQTYAMSGSSTSGKQGVAFALDLAQLTSAKTVSGRSASTDQFQVQLVTASGTAYATATTTGTGTTAAVTAGAVPGTAYTFKEIATSGSLSTYLSTYTCVNAVTSSTTLPAANTSGTSVTITPAVDDQITCTFTNVGLSATSTPVNATNSFAGNTQQTDVFTLKNTSSVAGTLAVTSPTIVSSTGSTVTPTAYTFNGNMYATVSALNSAIAAAGTTAAGGTISVGVSYATNSGSASSTDTVNLPVTVTSGAATSPAATGTEVDTITASSTAGTNCYVATGLNTHLICWLDFTGYAGTGTQTFSLKMPDGSILSGTVANTGSNAYTINAAPVVTTGIALGLGAYTGIAGKPVFYQGLITTKSPIVLSNLTLTDPNGYSITTLGMGAADAERTDESGGGEVLSWSTTGAAFTNLQLMPASPATSNICTLSALGVNVTCTGVTTDPVNGYLLRSILNTTASGSASSINMAVTSSGAYEGFAYGIDLSLLTVSKTVSTRVSSSDQFTVSVRRATNVPTPVPTGTPVATATTSGTGTSATATTPYYVVPNENYVFAEAMAAGSASALSQYATTVNCTNAMPTTGVTQVLPAANTAAQSVVVVPQPDSEITCAFTNVGITMTNVPVAATATDPAGTTETDKFTLTNTSAIAATFTVGTPTITPFTGTTAGTAFAPTGYTLTVGSTTTTYTTLAALNTAIAGMAPTAAGGSIVVGVTYTTTAGATTSDVVALPATDASGTGTSATTTGTETDTLTANAALTIAKTGTTATSPGGLIAYSILVGNNGPSPATGAIFSDPLPTGLTITGTPTCATTSGGAVCGTVTVSGQTVSSTIGTFPSGSSLTFTITASAAATCANGTSPCTYTNTASIADSGVATTQTSSLSTTVTTANGLSKTVSNVTQGGTAGTSNTAKPGDVLQYVLTFTNATGQPLYGVTISDPIPANTTYYTGNSAVTCVVAQSSGTLPPCTAAYTTGTTTISGTLPSKASGGNPLTAGGTVTLTFQVKVN